MGIGQIGTADFLFESCFLFGGFCSAALHHMTLLLLSMAVVRKKQHYWEKDRRKYHSLGGIFIESRKITSLSIQFF